MKKKRSSLKKSRRRDLVAWTFGGIAFAIIYGAIVYTLYRYIQTHRKSDIFKAQRDVLRDVPDPNNQTYNEYRRSTTGIITLVIGYISFVLLIIAGAYCAIRSDDKRCNDFPVTKAVALLVLPSILAFLVFLHMLRMKDKEDTYFKAWFSLFSVLIIPFVCFVAVVVFFFVPVATTRWSW